MSKRARDAPGAPHLLEAKLALRSELSLRSYTFGSSLDDPATRTGAAEWLEAGWGAGAGAGRPQRLRMAARCWRRAPRARCSSSQQRAAQR